MACSPYSFSSYLISLKSNTDCEPPKQKIAVVTLMFADIKSLAAAEQQDPRCVAQRNDLPAIA